MFQLTCFLIRDPFIESHILEGGWSTVATELNFERALKRKQKSYISFLLYLKSLYMVST